MSAPRARKLMATVAMPNSSNAPSLGSGPGQRSGAAASEAASVPDPQLVAEMKHEINVLVQEVTQLAAQDIAPEEFYGGFLARVVSAMAAAGGAVWLLTDGGVL